MGCEKANRLNVFSILLRGKWKTSLDGRFSATCYAFYEAYCIIQPVLNGQFKHLHKNKSFKEIRFRF